MAQFGWAYINCSDTGAGSGSAGPAYSLQFVSESGGGTTGSAYLTYYTASTYNYDPSTIVLSGNLIITGGISASYYHIEDIAIIDATGSTYFGDDQTDIHARTGSLEIYSDSALVLKANVLTSQTRLQGFRGGYARVTSTPYTGAVSSMVLGVDTADSDVTICVPSASSAGAGAIMVIKDQTTRTSSKIYVSGSTGTSQELIDSASYYVLSGTFPAINLYSDGDNWWIF
jgi:hypothetical protein